VIAWQVREPLRTSECQVYVTFRREGETLMDSVAWRFYVDLVSGYLPEPPVKLAAPGATPVTEAPDSGGEGADAEGAGVVVPR
jgi:hypothetical protein